MIIYKITNKINSKIYIGATKNEIKKRWQQHKSYAKNNKNYPLYNAMRKYGVENFQIEIIYIALSKKDMYKKEIYFIKKYKSRNKKIGYNISKGGEGNNSGKSWSKGLTKNTNILIKKISKRQTGAGNSFYGKKHTEKWKKDHSATISGKNHPNYGKKLPWLSTLNKKRIWTDEAKAKISKANSKPIICVELNKLYPSIKSMCDELKLDFNSVKKVLKGIFKQTKGYTFKIPRR